MSDFTRILQTDPHAGYLARRDAIEGAIQRVLESGWYILGDEVAAFEREFARYIGVSHGIGVGSGTDALSIALRACGIGEGDEVITVSHTAVATVVAVEESGAKPVLVDVDPGSYTLDPRKLDKAVSRRTRAIVPVHLYGLAADMEAICGFAKERGISVIEDCAQAHGAEYHGRKCGSVGICGCFSFYPTKNLGAIGDGGCVVTGDAELAERIRSLREYGWRQRYVSETAGINSRLDELQAAILRANLPELDRDNDARRALARVYDGLLGGDALVLPGCPDDRKHVYHQYAVMVDRRDAVRGELGKRGIGAGVHYPVPVHLQPAYRGLAEAGSLPVSERLCKETLSLPMYPQLSVESAERVARALLEIIT